MLRPFVYTQNNWVPRRVDNNPKKIGEIHNEAREEQQTKMLLARAMPSEPRLTAPARHQKNSEIQEDGWSTPAPPKTRAVPVDPSRMKISKTAVDAENIQLGPSTRHATWQKGSSGGGGRNAADDSELVAASNRSVAL